MFTPIIHKNSIDETFKDIRSDSLFLTSLAKSYIQKVITIESIVTKSTLGKETVSEMMKFIVPLKKQFEHFMVDCTKTVELFSPDNEEFCIRRQYELLERLRVLIGITSGILTSLEWQSPSFTSTTSPQVGIDIGKIKQAYNDYKRDQHSLAQQYEKDFLRQYVDAPVKIPFFVYLTSSGMAALTTICGFIQGETEGTHPIMVGKSCYFEEKLSLQTFFQGRIIEMDELNEEEMLSLVEKHKPEAIFLDSLANNETLALPNLSSFIQKLKKIVTWKTYLIIDNTGRGVTFQPYDLSVFFNPRLHIICWESLIKHHQMGLDRVNAGIIYSRANTAGKLYFYRDHMGTNISDVAAISLPTPNRHLLETRLLRHERNLQILIQELSAILPQSTTITDIISPAFSSHPSSKWSNFMSFHGGFLSIRFVHNKKSTYESYLKRAFSLAKERNVPLIGGSSFGVSITRLYIPAILPHQGIPFVRIAVGTEPSSAFFRVAHVLRDALE